MKQTINITNLPRIDYRELAISAIKIHVQNGTPKLDQIRRHFVDDLKVINEVEFSRLLSQYRPQQGIGDTIAVVTQITGIDKAVNWIAKLFGKKSCGCGARREKLNAVLPFRKQTVTMNVVERVK